MEVRDIAHITGERLSASFVHTYTASHQNVNSRALSGSSLLAYAAAALEALQIPQGTVRLLFKALSSKG